MKRMLLMAHIAFIAAATSACMTDSLLDEETDCGADCARDTDSADDSPNGESPGPCENDDSPNCQPGGGGPNGGDGPNGGGDPTTGGSCENDDSPNCQPGGGGGGGGPNDGDPPPPGTCENDDSPNCQPGTGGGGAGGGGDPNGGGDTTCHNGTPDCLPDSDGSHHRVATPPGHPPGAQGELLAEAGEIEPQLTVSGQCSGTPYGRSTYSFVVTRGVNRHVKVKVTVTQPRALPVYSDYIVEIRQQNQAGQTRLVYRDFKRPSGSPATFTAGPNSVGLAPGDNYFSFVAYTPRETCAGGLVWP